jgi:UDP-GlcNAc:undecaprenyl-phosphate/decaprenyl-phosphate GlcNAc-1-phosphate transferase
MNVTAMLYCLLLGCLISLLIIPLMLLTGLKRSLRRLVRRLGSGELPEKNDGLPIPRLGGVALAAAFVGVSLLIYFLYPATWAEKGRLTLGIVWTALAMFFVGIWDDYHPLGGGRKLLVQSLISIAACVQGIHLEAFGSPLQNITSHLGVWSWVFTVLWLVALTNLFQRFDVVSGLAGGVGFVVLSLLAYAGAAVGTGFSALCAIGMAGALLGFLVYNLPPARIHMGGGGTGLIGFLIANFSIVHPGQQTSMAVILVLALPLLGIGLAIWPGASRLSPSDPSSHKLTARRLGTPAISRSHHRS